MEDTGDVSTLVFTVSKYVFPAEEGLIKPAPELKTTVTEPLFEIFTGVVIVIVRVPESVVGEIDNKVPFTVTLLAAILAGTVVLLGYIKVIVPLPAVKAPEDPTENWRLYAAAELTVVGFGVTVADDRLVPVIV